FTCFIRSSLSISFPRYWRYMVSFTAAFFAGALAAGFAAAFAVFAGLTSFTSFSAVFAAFTSFSAVFTSAAFTVFLSCFAETVFSTGVSAAAVFFAALTAVLPFSSFFIVFPPSFFNFLLIKYHTIVKYCPIVNKFFFKVSVHISVIEYFCAFLYIIVVYIDRKSTRLNSSHVSISYAYFFLNK